MSVYLYFTRFPANHVEEIRTESDDGDGTGASCEVDPAAAAGSIQGSQAQPLGILQKGSYDIVGVTVEVKPNTRPGQGRLEYVVRMAHPVTLAEFEVAAESKDEALQVNIIFHSLFPKNKLELFILIF